MHLMSVSVTQDSIIVKQGKSVELSVTLAALTATAQNNGSVPSALQVVSNTQTKIFATLTALTVSRKIQRPIHAIRYTLNVSAL
jgi:hypothetical protein